MRLPFRQGLVKSNELFITVNGSKLDLTPDNTPARFALAHRDADYLHTENVNIGSAWSIPAGSDTHYLYIDLDILTAVRTFGRTTIAPTHGSADTRPTTLVDGSHWYNTTEMQMYVYSTVSGEWLKKIRIFVARYTNGGTVQYYPTDTQVGVYDITRPVGSIVYDSRGKALKNSNGEFFTTESDFHVANAYGHSMRLESSIVQAQAGEPIPAFHVVRYSDFSTVMLAEYEDTDGSIIGVALEDAVRSAPITLVLSGEVTNISWDWSEAQVGSPLWIDSNGELTTTDPFESNGSRGDNNVSVAKISGKHSIIFEQADAGIRGEPGAKGDQGIQGPAGGVLESGELQGTMLILTNDDASTVEVDLIGLDNGFDFRSGSGPNVLMYNTCDDDSSLVDTNGQNGYELGWSSIRKQRTGVDGSGCFTIEIEILDGPSITSPEPYLTFNSPISGWSAVSLWFKTSNDQSAMFFAGNTLEDTQSIQHIPVYSEVSGDVHVIAYNDNLFSLECQIGEWNHVILAHSGTDTHLWLNGKKDPVVLSNAGVFDIHHMLAGLESFTSVDHVRVYQNTALPQIGDVVDLYNEFDRDTRLISTSVSGKVVQLQQSDGSTLDIDLTSAIPDATTPTADTFVASGALSGTDIILTHNDATTVSIDATGLTSVLVDETAPKLGGALGGQGNVIDNIEIRRYSETVQTPSTSATTTVNFAIGSVASINLTQHTTLSFVNPPAAGLAGSMTLVFSQNSPGSYTVTLPASVTRGELDLATSSGDQTIATLITIDGGANYTIMTAHKD